jgi:hypothetical protein
MKANVVKIVSLLSLVALFSAGAVRVSAFPSGCGSACEGMRTSAAVVVPAPGAGAGASLLYWAEMVALAVTLF